MASGMDPGDARLALERHATSKIRRADDLASDHDVGLPRRGAPSIASVSHFMLRTAPEATRVGPRFG